MQNYNFFSNLFPFTNFLFILKGHPLLLRGAPLLFLSSRGGFAAPFMWCRSALGDIGKFHPNSSHIPPITDGKIMGRSWEDHGKIMGRSQKFHRSFTEATPKEGRDYSNVKNPPASRASAACTPGGWSSFNRVVVSRANPLDAVDWVCPVDRSRPHSGRGQCSRAHNGTGGASSGRRGCPALSPVPWRKAR